MLIPAYTSQNSDKTRASGQFKLFQEVGQEGYLKMARTLASTAHVSKPEQLIPEKFTTNLPGMSEDALTQWINVKNPSPKSGLGQCDEL